MDLFEYQLDEHVAVVTMKSGENRFTLTFLEAFLNILDEIENKTPATVLVVKSADSKIWSNGIDLDWLRSAVTEKPETGPAFSMQDHGRPATYFNVSYDYHRRHQRPCLCRRRHPGLRFRFPVHAYRSGIFLLSGSGYPYPLYAGNGRPH